jgi:hypothetical protein
MRLYMSGHFFLCGLMMIGIKRGTTKSKAGGYARLSHRLR